MSRVLEMLQMDAAQLLEFLKGQARTGTRFHGALFALLRSAYAKAASDGMRSDILNFLKCYIDYSSTAHLEGSILRNLEDMADAMPASWAEQLREMAARLENGMAAGDRRGNVLLLQRELQGDGRNVCRVDGRLVTVAQLRELGRQLLNIHGQHDGQQLLDPASHLGYLDRFGRHEPLLEEYRAAYHSWHDLRKRIAALQMDEAERSRRVDTLNYQIRELERAELRPGEDEELDARRTLLRSAGKLMEAVRMAEFALSGDEDSAGACALVADAEGAVQSVSSISPELGELGERLTALRCAADDAADSLRDLSRTFDFSPGELDEVEERLDLLYRLRKKYGPTVEEMLAYLYRCRQELDQIQYADDTIARLEKELGKAEKEARKRGQALSQARQTSAQSLRDRVQEELRQLDMPKVRFEVEFAPKGGEAGMDETGVAEIPFGMSAALGEALKPIQKVASGGELARIMLALKNVLAEGD